MALSPEAAATTLKFLERTPVNGTNEAAALLRCVSELKSCLPAGVPPLGKTPTKPPAPKRNTRKKAQRKVANK